MGKRELGLLGFGLGLGAALALLYAPKSGAVTRRFVRAKAGSAAGFVKDKTATLKEAALGTVAQGKQKLEDAKDTLATAYQVGMDRYEAEINAPLP